MEVRMMTPPVKFKTLLLSACMALAGPCFLAAFGAAPMAAWASPGSGSDGTPDDDIEDDIEDDVEDDVEDQIEDDVEDDVEDSIEDDIEDSVEDDVEDDIESDIEDSVEADIEDQVEDDVEADLESDIEDDVEGDIEDAVEDRVESRINDKVDDKVEDKSGRRGKREKDVEDRIEDRVEERVDSRGSGKIDTDDVFDDQKDLAKIEYEASRNVADIEQKAAREAAKDAMEAALAMPGADKDAIKAQYELEKDAADAAHDAQRAEADETFKSALAQINAGEEEAEGGEESSESSGDDDDDGEYEDENEHESGGESGEEDGDDDNSGPDSANSGRAADDDEDHDDDDEDEKEDHSGHGSGKSASVELGERAFAIAQDENGNDIGQGEWLMIAPASALEILERQGYVTRELDNLDSLGMVLARIEAPASLSLADAEAAIRAAAPEAELDYNHIYEPGVAATEGAQAQSPADIFSLPEAHDSVHRIGVIDTAVDGKHPALVQASIVARDFVSYGYTRPVRHGTSVVSILAGSGEAYRGLAPDAKIFAASVFFEAPPGGQSATTVSLVRAIDWMLESGVSIVNMSLTGPRNDILKAAIDRAYEQGTVVVAAVGNAGPAAKPLYPAAYDNVVAVTAISLERKAYRLANRGAHVDFAAPGVAIRHADENGGYSESSGTSMAAPFVAAMLALSCETDGSFDKGRLKEFAGHATDLGEPGFDAIYGYGLITPLP